MRRDTSDSNLSSFPPLYRPSGGSSFPSEIIYNSQIIKYRGSGLCKLYGVQSRTVPIKEMIPAVDGDQNFYCCRAETVYVAISVIIVLLNTCRYLTAIHLHLFFPFPYSKWRIGEIPSTSTLPSHDSRKWSPSAWYLTTI